MNGTQLLVATKTDALHRKLNSRKEKNSGGVTSGSSSARHHVNVCCCFKCRLVVSVRPLRKEGSAHDTGAAVCVVPLSFSFQETK